METAARLRQLFQQDSLRVQSLGKSSGTAVQVHSHLQSNPFAVIREIAAATHKTLPAVAQALANLEQLGIVTEITGHRRNRIYTYKKFLDVIGEGTEPLPR